MPAVDVKLKVCFLNSSGYLDVRNVSEMFTGYITNDLLPWLDLEWRSISHGLLPSTRYAKYKSIIEIVNVPDAIAGPTPSLLCTCLGLPRYRHKCWSLWSGSHRSTRSIRWALWTRWAYSARVQFLNLKSQYYRMVLMHKNRPISIFVQINLKPFSLLVFPQPAVSRECPAKL